MLREEGTIFCNDEGCWVDNRTDMVYDERMGIEEIRKKLYSTKDFTEATDETSANTFVSDKLRVLDDGYTMVES